MCAAAVMAKGPDRVMLWCQAGRGADAHERPCVCRSCGAAAAGAHEAMRPPPPRPAATAPHMPPSGRGVFVVKAYNEAGPRGHCPPPCTARPARGLLRPWRWRAGHTARSQSHLGYAGERDAERRQVLHLMGPVAVAAYDAKALGR
jgi:hypothetical protein